MTERAGVMRRRPEGGLKKTAVIAAMAGVLLTVYFFSFVFGRYDVPVSGVFRILLGSGVNKLAALFGRGPLVDLTAGGALDGTMIKAVINVRFPRITAAALVGCCLSAAGASYQGVFQNPMAAPDILGASNGAAFGAALAILLGGGAVMTSVSAFAFSVATVAVVFLIARKAPGRKVINLILAGIMIGSFMTAGTSYIKDETVFDDIKEEDKLILQREPQNRFDENAILVLDSQKRKLGYIPEKDNIVFARLMDAGKYLTAKVKYYEPKGAFKQISISIYLVDF